MWFKIIIAVMLTTGFLYSCAPVKKSVQSAKPQKVELVPNEQDSSEYELIIMDPGFEPWFEMNRKPIWYHTNDYLANWNYQYVVAWNAKVRDPLFTQSRTDSPFTLEIDYRPNVDYGIDLNYKLYYYFRYIEAIWGKILPYDRQN